MKPNPGRIAVLTLIAASLAGAAVLAPLLLPRNTSAATQPATWIPMPPDGMDARQGAVRELLEQTQAQFADASTLAARCGIDAQAGEPNEQYAIAIGDGALAPNAEHWDVGLVPSGDSMEVTIQIISPYPPPAPPEPGKAPSSAIEVRDRSLQYRIDLKALQPIHDALLSPELWLAPQGEEPFECRDGRRVMIEACVHGRYIARLRNCDVGSGEPAQKLLDLLRRQFPQAANRP